MGFTKCHLRDVFITKSALVAIGVGLVVASFLFTPDRGTRLLLVAISVLLLRIGVLLSSILSLLFYAGENSALMQWKQGEPDAQPNRDSTDASPPVGGLHVG